jgi:hypothetical protein
MMRPRNIILRIVNRVIVKFGYTIVPVRPSDGLLVSMATRYDRTFGINAGNIYPGGYTPESRKRLLDKMKQVHEEVVGIGCYDPAREDYYKSLVVTGWTIPFNGERVPKHINGIASRFPRKKS